MLKKEKEKTVLKKTKEGTGLENEKERQMSEEVFKSRKRKNGSR